jgi:hypothetical protein
VAVSKGPTTTAKAKIAPRFLSKTKNGSKQFLFTDVSFEKVVGGKAAAIELKRDLHHRTLIETSGASGPAMKFVVKRLISGKTRSRSSVVAVDAVILDIDR